MSSPPKIRVVIATCVVAAIGIVLANLAAVLLLTVVDPDVPAGELLAGPSGLIASGLASSIALGLTVVVASAGLSPAALRLVPGRESGAALGVMILGMLGLGQALDSLMAITGLGRRGSMETIRAALASASGPGLFLAVLVIGFAAGVAEEVFFRGYVQSQLRARWRPATAILATSACFGLFHADWIHTPLAFAIGLYLGFITELSGSALPAIACHVVNNSIVTVLTAQAGSLAGFWPNLAMLAFTVALFVSCVLWLRRMVPSSPPHPV